MVRRIVVVRIRFGHWNGSKSLVSAVLALDLYSCKKGLVMVASESSSRVFVY